MDLICSLWQAAPLGQSEKGHAGTLDPMATGLLIVCVGKATKLVERYQGMIKGYSEVFRFGKATSTWDAHSPVIQREPWEHIKDEDTKKTATSFCGDRWQVPPMFSAIKVGGEKKYKKARRGESVELPPRQISVFHFDIERSLDGRQDLIFRVIRSKGTYIRSLCAYIRSLRADFGKALGSCAHLTALRRDSIGKAPSEKNCYTSHFFVRFGSLKGALALAARLNVHGKVAKRALFLHTREYAADDAWEFKEQEEAITKGYFQLPSASQKPHSHYTDDQSGQKALILRKLTY